MQNEIIIYYIIVIFIYLNIYIFILSLLRVNYSEQVHATDKDTGVYGSIRYTSITGEGSEAFTMDSHTGFITVAMGSSLDREVAAMLVLTVEARDENGNGNSGVVPLIVNLIDVNDNAPMFEKDVYEFMLNSDLTNFTSPALIKVHRLNIIILTLNNFLHIAIYLCEINIFLKYMYNEFFNIYLFFSSEKCIYCDRSKYL